MSWSRQILAVKWFVGVAFGVVYLLAFVTVTTWPKYEAYAGIAILSLVIVYLAYHIVLFIFALYGTKKEMRSYRATGEPPVRRLGQLAGLQTPSSSARFQEALRRLEGTPGPNPPWLEPAIRSWTESAEGPENDRRRDDLLVRLYYHAAFSTDTLAKRKALNELRLAINPWVD